MVLSKGSRGRCVGVSWPLWRLSAAVSAGGAVAGVTTTDRSGTVVQDGSKVSPLCKGPDAGSTTPDGTNAFAEVASAGATMLKIGPATTA
jgi:hypothetical protein